jgi:hypothetical protein
MPPIDEPALAGIFAVSVRRKETHHMHKLYALLSFIAGALLAWTGWKISRPYNRPPQATGFSGPVVSRHLLVGVAGNLLLILGMVIAVLFTMIFLLM